ncbi:kinase-like domain-containing protein [Gymnopilus junonius]|uniref:Kinase-like domain-containing protein n=1 Tax=Gymnopilus junonius TaxID=109634 RepID=A0A9P5NF59_GYMJU|nr:kinase-like domain-containing protein [Gymnopilus junonius]
MVLIPFDPAVVRFDRKERWQWWDSMRGWFAERVIGRPSRLYSGPADFPYPYMGSDNEPTDYSNNWGQGRVVFAQDNEGRHLAIKLLKAGSEEVKIAKFLKDESCLRDLESFPVCTAVLDLLPCEDHWFIIMPRWGEVSYSPWFPTMYHAVLHMRCLLKALVFLHRCRIFHGDVAHRNILVNILTSFRDRQEEKSRYALFDFDCSIMLDEETYGENPRLPIHSVDRGLHIPPYELLLGYPDFDPFKYDVACLGIYFDETFAEYIPTSPLLAPLIDRMLTADIEKRFSASQALDFTEYILSNVSQTTRSWRKPRSWSGGYYERDRWNDLPEDFVSTWASYRDNSFSSITKIQLWFVFRGGMPAWYVLYSCRCIHRAVSGIPKAIQRIFRNIFSAFIS